MRILYARSLSLSLSYIMCLVFVYNTLQFLLLICPFFIISLRGKFYPLDKSSRKILAGRQIYSRKFKENEHIWNITRMCLNIMRHKERKSDVNSCLQLMTRAKERG